MTSVIYTLMVVTIAVLLLKFGIFSNAYQYQSDQVLTIYFEDDSDGLYPGNGNVTWTNQVLFSPPLLTDRVPSLAAYSSIHLLIKRSNQALNLSNTNDRRECRKQNTTMLLLLILLGGDVQMNPGPNKYPCGICDRPVAKTTVASSVTNVATGSTSNVAMLHQQTMNCSYLKNNLLGFAHAVLFPTLVTASSMRAIWQMQTCLIPYRTLTRAWKLP